MTTSNLVLGFDWIETLALSNLGVKVVLFISYAFGDDETYGFGEDITVVDHDRSGSLVPISRYYHNNKQLRMWASRR